MIGAIADELAPNLVARNSIGQTEAAQLLLTAGDNPERLRSEASFAALCCVSPVPASSGKIVRHRLNPGGDRAANSALHIIAIGRLRTDQRTKHYVARRIAEGHSKLDAIRYCGGAIRWLLRSGYHRHACKQSERGVPPDVTVSSRGRSPTTGRFRNSHLAHGSSVGVRAIDCPLKSVNRPSQTPGGDDGLPEEHAKTRNHDNPKDKSPRVRTEDLVVGIGQPVGIAHVKLLDRPPASQPHQTLIKIS